MASIESLVSPTEGRAVSVATTSHCSPSEVGRLAQSVGQSLGFDVEVIDTETDGGPELLAVLSSAGIFSGEQNEIVYRTTCEPAADPEQQLGRLSFLSLVVSDLAERVN